MRPQQADHLQAVDQRPADRGARWRMPYAARPRFIQLETVTKCNAECPFCPQHEIRRDPARMPDATWQKIVDDTRGWGVTYRPFLTNEPFVDKRQAGITRYIKQNDPTARVEYNTNGELMTEQLGRDLLEAGVDIIRFSIDGFSAATYEPSRVGIPYEKVLERTTRFLEIWDQEGWREKVFTEVRMIEVPENRHEIAAYRAYWEPRCTEVLVTQLYQWPWTGQKREDVVLKPCLKILDEMFFYSDGDATVCCWDVHGRAVIGNVNRASVQEIWEGHAAAVIRAALDDGRRDLLQLCSRCNAYQDYDFAKFAAR
ncbi:MAG: radical SAM/SPASM domain-containing protein [Candidatus Krumholzibacteriia bacterium]